MENTSILSSRVVAFAAAMVLCGSVWVATTVQVGASGKTYASSAVQCAAAPTTGTLSPMVEAGLFNPTSKTRGTVSLNDVPVANVTSVDPSTGVWLTDGNNTVVVSLNKKMADHYAFTVQPGMWVVLVFSLMGTGVLLKFVYQPFPEKAYESILHLQNEVLFGQLIRNIHHWSANALILVAFLHLLRVFFTGAFHAPRQFNWVIGSGLFLLVLLSNFTGYLLPWDQLAFWAITICTGMLEYMAGIGLWIQTLIQGGPEVGPGTLSNFYAIHTAILPASLLTLLPLHFWRIRKAGPRHSYSR